MSESSPGTGLSPLSAAELAQVAAELTAELAGHGIGKIYDAPNGLVLELGRTALLLSVHPRASRAHRVDRVPAAGAPSAFAMLCRKRLSGLRLEALRVLPGERILIVDVGAARERLVAELTGPHGNVFLVEPGDRIAGILRRSGSTTRTLGPGTTWTPPAPVADQGAFGPSSSNAGRASPEGAGPTRWRDARRFGESPGVAERVRLHYAAVLADSERAELVARAGVAIKRDVVRLRRRAAALHGDLAKAEAAQIFRKLGDLLLAHLHELPKRGATSVTVSDDFEDGSPLTIVLDPTLDGRGNATRYYRQHKRLAAGLVKIRARADETARTLAAREDLLQRLPSMTDAELAPLAARAPAPAQRPRTPDPEDVVRLPYRVFRAQTGDPIWVGRSATDNDSLTFRHARGADLWLHTRDAPGAHVVVPMRGQTKLTDQLLLDAATLAAHHSPLGGEAQVDIAYTTVKNVRKGKGMAPGAVFTSNTKTIRVRLEEARLKRLMTADDAL